MITEDEIDALFCIDPNARQYISERGGIIHIGIVGSTISKAEAGPVPMIELGEPRGAQTKYLRFQVGAITIYLAKSLPVTGPILITLDTLWRLKKLSVQMALENQLG